MSTKRPRSKGRSQQIPTMIPKGKLLALVLAFAAVGGLAATGAFTSVEAERTADVSVSGDAGALLALEQTDGTDNSEFIESGTGASELVIDLNSSLNLNSDALTDTGGVINVTNNGEDTVNLNISVGTVESGVNVVFYEAGSDDSGTFLSASNQFSETFETLSDDTDDLVLSGTTDSATLNPGDTVQIGFAVEIVDDGTSISDTVFDDVTFIAE